MIVLVLLKEHVRGDALSCACEDEDGTSKDSETSGTA